MVLTLVLGVGNTIFQSLKMPAGSTVTTYQAFCIALAAILLMVFSLVASRLATDLVIGGPSLGVGTGINTTAIAYNTSVGAAAGTGRSAITAVKYAATLPTQGASLVYSAGNAAVRGVARTISGSTDSVASATTPGSGATGSPTRLGGSAGSSSTGGSTT
jgi:type IV secretory pathway TrbL component